MACSIRSPLLKDDIRNWCTLLSLIVQQYFKNQRLEQITRGGVFGFLMKNSWFCTTLSSSFKIHFLEKLYHDLDTMVSSNISIIVKSKNKN